MIRILFTVAINLLFCSVTLSQKNVIFSEDFENFNNDWLEVNDEEFKVRQEGGRLNLSKASTNRIMNGCLWYKKTINGLETHKDFHIEFDAKTISSEFYDKFFDFQWGIQQEFDGVMRASIYQMDFGANNVRLSRLVPLKNWQYFKWSNELMDSSLSKFNIERGVYNKFEIIQNDGLLMVKINGKLVYKLPIDVQSGSEIGFQHCLKGEWEIDNIIIKQ